MEEKQQHAEVSRRDFLKIALATPVALGTLGSMPAEAFAATSSTVTLHKNFVKVKAPKAWKGKFSIVGMGHSSGYYHLDFYYRAREFSYGLMPLRFESGVGTKKYGKTKVSSGKIKNNAVTWTLRRGKVVVYATAENIPYIIWRSVHNRGSWAGKISEKRAKELLKLTTGNKIKYSQLINWTEKKAKTKGVKAVRDWVGKKVVKRCTIV